MIDPRPGRVLPPNRVAKAHQLLRSQEELAAVGDRVDLAQHRLKNLAGELLIGDDPKAHAVDREIGLTGEQRLEPRKMLLDASSDRLGHLGRRENYRGLAGVDIRLEREGCTNQLY
jgi:hypothetical protein